MKNHNFVYITTNTINGKQYIGEHSSDILDDNYLGSGYYLKRAISKYGKELFVREILEICNSKEEAFHKQYEYICKFNTLNPNGYNISPHGGYGVNGCSLSEETKRKISQSEKGKFVSPESIEKMKVKLRGKKHSGESKHKMSESQKGEKCFWFGKTHLDQTKEKIRTTLLNRAIPTSKTTLDKLSSVTKGRIWVVNHKEEHNKRIWPREFDQYKILGYERGFTKDYKKK
jgi:group I intron endonuclease